MIDLNPIIVARKPISEKTVVDNVLEWGTGAINIDESRIGFVSEADKKESTQKNQHADFGTKPLTGNVIYGDYSMVQPKNYNPPGRFPANLIIDEEAGKLLDEQSGISKSSGGSGEKSKGALGNSVYGKYKNEELASNAGGLGDIGGASRFFKKVNYEDDEVIGVNVMSEVRLVLGDCLDKLKEMDDNSVDSIVTDPPYGLSFMGKQWDYDVPSVEIWQECLRVLKPGGHLLAFAGSRTYHRMAVRIEDAGFEIRDMISWLYGSGFPKSMDISKQIDKRKGVEREVVGSRLDAFGDVDESETDDGRNLWGKPSTTEINVYSKEAVSDLAKQWSGWGTALKPAHEPVVMARKPISEKTVVDNVLEWGTGGINIDESRIGNEALEYRTTSYKEAMSGEFSGQGQLNSTTGTKSVEGRFPANLILDEEAGKLLDEQSGVTKSGKVKENKSAYGGDSNTGFLRGVSTTENQYGDIGGASRFFYCPKVGKSERNEGLDGFADLPGNVVANASGRPYKLFCQTCGKRQGICKCETANFGYENPNTTKNIHPTVKPVDLMLYLIRLVTPKGGTTLDPFMGSGSTGKAAVRGGFGFVGIEREQEYFDIAEARIEYERNRPVGKSSDKKKNKTVEPKVEETLTKFFE